MNCTQASECISALFDSQSISREVASHLADCPECRAQLNEYAEMGAELRDMASSVAPQTIPEGRWRLAEPAAANSWLRKWRGTMRIPRFAFALMLIAIFALSGGLALVRARPGGNGPWLSLTFKVPPTGQIMHLSTKTDHEAEIGSFGVLGLPGHIWTSVRFIRREGQRVELLIKTVYHEPRVREPNGETADEALKDIPAQDYWLDPDEELRIQVAGLGAMEVSGQFVDYVPIVPHRPNEPFDPLPDEFRLWNPVLLRENRVLVNMAPLKTTDTGNDAAAMLYSPGLGRFIFSSVPVQGGIEGKLQVNQISFALDGKDYLLIAGAPITRSDRIWVLYQPDWRPPSLESNPSSDHAMLGATNVHDLLEMK